MRNGLIGLGSAITIAAMMATAACTTEDNGGGATGGTAPTVGGGVSAGGSTAAGGTPGAGGSAPSSGGQNASGGSSTAAGGSTGNVGGGAATCTDVTPCGGNIVGTWTVKSACLAVDGEADLTFAGIGCTSAGVKGTRQVTGTWTTNADGKVTDGTTTSGNDSLTLAAACLSVSGTITTCERVGFTLQSMGYSSVTCKNAATGGGCECAAVVQQSGGIGVLSMYPITSGNYSTANNVITTTDGVESTPYAYCIAGNTLTMSPQSSAITGSIVLEKQ